MNHFKELTTEKENENTQNIDKLDSLEIVKLINNEDKKVAYAIEKELKNIAYAIDKIVERFDNGGRIIYCGAGSSGRIGASDAAELTPTYNLEQEKAFSILAGGESALYKAIEGAEDSIEMSVNQLKEVNLNSNDCVIGIAASGNTPYTISALKYANEVGALSIAITSNEESEICNVAQISIVPIVGPEVISGSTRMKAGTAQKMILNMISTGVMIRVGKVYKNYMVNLQPTNKKLIKRSCNIISKVTNVSLEESKDFLEKANMNVSNAIIMIKTGANFDKTVEALNYSKGRIQQAIDFINSK